MRVLQFMVVLGLVSASLAGTNAFGKKFLEVRMPLHPVPPSFRTAENIFVQLGCCTQAAFLRW